MYSQQKFKKSSKNDTRYLLYRFSFWSSDEREMIGLMSKRIIDIGRTQYLQSIGYNANLAIYVTKDTSLENVMLIAS